MKLSVLIPARNGYNALERTINSIFENESKKNNIQVCIKLDNDDIETIEKLIKHKYFYRITLLIYDRLLGYQNIHIFYNDLAKLHNDSDWFLIFNSDAEILTKDWDLLYDTFDSNKPHIIHHNPVKNRGGGNYYFPTISKKYYDICGYISLVYDYDGYLLNLGKKTNIISYIKLNIEHFNAEYDLVSMKNAHTMIKTRDNSLYDKECIRIINQIANER